MKFLLALRFLTIFRLPGARKQIDPVELGRSTVYFPLVGLVIGLVLGGLAWVMGNIMPLPLANALLVAGALVINGGMHIDGFIDTCDGIGGQKTVEERWRIMHESSVGAFGIAGAVLLLLVKFAALNSIPQNYIILSMILMPVVSRWLMVFGLVAFPYARRTGMGKAFKEGTKLPSFLVATIITLALAIMILFVAKVTFFYFVAPALMMVILLAITGVGTYLKNKFAGLTGDCYGAINEIAEVSVLILVSILAFNHWI